MKTMLVTGASSGIGRALAVRAARAGYAVYAVGRNRSALETLRAKIEAERGFVAVDATDVAAAANAAPLVARALAQFGSIDVLVNNAGFVSTGDLCRQADSELERQFGTHVIGPIALVREALGALRSAGGHVFVLGSGVARIPLGGFGAYPPAKAAIRSATAILRRELAPLGVAVTYVDPGAVDTPFMSRAGMAAAPSNLLVSPEEVARKILVSVAKQPRILNAVPWQTAAVALAERFPRITEFVLTRVPALVGGDTHAVDAFEAGATALDGAANSGATGSSNGIESIAGDRTGREETEPSIVAADPFAAALEPHRRRMDKLNLQVPFIRDLLVPGTTLDLGEIALRWAGMPNKNERLITENVLEALADAGYLERNDDHGYRVLRSP